MGVIEKAASASALDLDRFRLRRFVEELGADELETRREPIDLADVAAAPAQQAISIRARIGIRMGSSPRRFSGCCGHGLA